MQSNYSLLSPTKRKPVDQTETIATPNQMVDALHTAFGKHVGARAVHAKGIILEGDFTPTAEASQLTTALHLQSSAVPITVRFSDFTGIPDIADTIGGANPRGLAIKFHLLGKSTMDIVAHSFDGFPVTTTDEFRSFLLAIGTSGPTASKPTPLDQFLDVHPIAKTFLTTQKPASVSYATLSYFGVNSFLFTNQFGQSYYVRYQFIPQEGEQFLTADQLASVGPNYLMEEIPIRIINHPIKFDFYAQLAEEGDHIEDPSIAWPVTRKRILLGIITIDKMAPNTSVEDKQLAFNPMNLPYGISPADPMLLDRSKAYPISVQERQ